MEFFPGSNHFFVKPLTNAKACYKKEGKKNEDSFHLNGDCVKIRKAEEIPRFKF